MNINKNKTISLSFIGTAFSLISILIFKFLPVSDIANGIEYSGKTALYVLALSPLFAVLGAVFFLVAYIKDYKQWEKISSKTIALCVTVFFALGLIFNFAVSLSFLISQCSLGFVAPFNDTVYETLIIIMGIITAAQLAFSAISAATIIRNCK